MKFYSYIESLTQPLDYLPLIKKAGLYETVFKLSDGDRILIIFDNTYDEDFVDNLNLSKKEKELINKEKKVWEIIFDRNGSVDITNKGQAFKILATVVKITKDFINKEKPKYLIFSAKEQSRVRLYDRFAKGLSMFGYKILSKNKDGMFSATSNETAWLLKRK